MLGKIISAYLDFLNVWINKHFSFGFSQDCLDVLGEELIVRLVLSCDSLFRSITMKRDIESLRLMVNKASRVYHLLEIEIEFINVNFTIWNSVHFILSALRLTIDILGFQFTLSCRWGSFSVWILSLTLPLLSHLRAHLLTLNFDRRNEWIIIA